MIRPPSPRSAALRLALGFLAGLGIKYWMLFYKGVFDMDAYYSWGKEALDSGLAASYHGIYFPIQYQFFELCVWITARLGSGFVPVFKLSNLLFDTGSFVLLLFLLERQRSNPAYALLYWLHPWFLSVFSLGYIDFQFTFFVLLSVACLSVDTTYNYLLSGIPLGLAFLMKPQAQILMIAGFLYGVFHYARTRSVRPLGLMVFPLILFLGYEIYFTASLFPGLGYRAANVLPFHYLNITNVMPSLTAQMLNIWYPVAYFLKQPGHPIYDVSDQIRVLPYLSAKYIAAAIVLGLVGFHAYRVERKTGAAPSHKFIDIFGLATMTVPLVMTSAHENHFFLGSVFLVIFVARGFPLSFRLAAHVLLFIQFLNIYGLYGEQPPWIAHFLRRTYSEELAVAYSVIDVLLFAVILKSLLANAMRPGRVCD